MGIKIKKILQSIKLFFELMPFYARAFFLELKIIFVALINGYYKSADTISAFCWDKIEEGKYNYLYKRNIIKTNLVPSFFEKVMEEIMYQFDHVDMEMITKRLNIERFLNLFVTSGRPDYLNRANELKAQIKKRQSKKRQKSTLNDQLNYIEFTFSIVGTIDPKKMSAKRFNSLYHKAIEENRRRKREYESKKRKKSK